MGKKVVDLFGLFCLSWRVQILALLCCVLVIREKRCWRKFIRRSYSVGALLVEMSFRNRVKGVWVCWRA